MPRFVEGITPRKGLMAPQNNFLDKIAKRFKGTRKFGYKRIVAPKIYNI